MPKTLLPVWVFGKIAIKRAFRDRLALFFIFLFPLIFLFVFGGIFGNNDRASFNVALISQSTTEPALRLSQSLRGQGEFFKIDNESDTLDKAREKISRGQLDAAIVLPAEYGTVRDNLPSGQVQIYYTQNNEQAGATLTSVLQGQLQEVNKQLVQTPVPFTVTATQLSDASLKPFDYTFAGLLGFSIIGLGIFGPINVFPELKKQGVLRRLHTTPLRVWQYFLSNVLSQSVVGLISIASQFIIAVLVFDLTLTGSVINWLGLAVYIVFSIIMILGIGLALGGWAQNERQAAPLGNLVVFPMLFLSGTFFPRFLMPEWLQTLSGFLPLTPVIDGIRLMATEGKNLIDIAPQVGLVGAWLVVTYLIAFKVFRWE